MASKSTDSSDILNYAQSQYQSYFKYLNSNIPAATTMMVSLSAMRGYFVGESLAMHFYIIGFTGGLISTSFFTGTYILKHIRSVDDITNYGISGCLNGALIRTGLNGLRSLPLGFVIGGLGGIGYHWFSHWMYDTSKYVWMNHRRSSLQFYVRSDVFNKLLDEDTNINDVKSVKQNNVN